MRRYFSWPIAILLTGLCLTASGANAVTLNVVGGQLVGASGVDVGGTLYNVEFLDGTCIDLFDGCDSLSDFTFTASVSATLAAQALLDQVFLDGESGQFDSVVSLTNGCEGPSVCAVYTPFHIDLSSEPGPKALAAVAHNEIGINLDSTGENDFSFLYNTTPAPSDTFARWSIVPEPSTALMMGLGLAGLALRRNYPASSRSRT